MYRIMIGSRSWRSLVYEGAACAKFWWECFDPNLSEQLGRTLDNSPREPMSISR
jgi:hypothetical protein